MDCIKCARKGIEYRCIGCKTPICNVCSTPCTDETPSYSEETYFVGKCNECQHGHKRKLPDHSTAAKSRQSSLASFFTKKSKTAVATKETVANSQQQQQQPGATSRTEAKVPSSSTESTPSAKKPARSLTVAAARVLNRRRHPAIDRRLLWDL